MRVQLEGELRALAAGELPAVEPLAVELEALPLVIGADGVMVPFRPHPRTAKGKTRWREVKVAILARLGARLSCQGTRVTRLCQRRLVAVLGPIDDLAPRLWLEAVRQGVRTAVQVVWLSDGGRGLWSVFQRLFQGVGVTAILDFYHAHKTCTKAPAPGWMGAPAPASNGLPIYVTGCGTATSSTCWRNWWPWSRPRTYPSLLSKP